MNSIKNLGLVSGIVRGATPPTRTDVLWYDGSILRAYHEPTKKWESILTSITEGSGKVSIKGEIPDYLGNKIDNDTIQTDGLKIYAPAKSPLYTNTTPTTTAVGGVEQGSTFQDLTMSQVFDKLFYAYQNPVLTLTNPSSRALEVGQSVNGNGLTASWTVTNVANIASTGYTLTYLPSGTVILQEANPAATSGVFDHPLTVRATAATVPMFKLSARNTKGNEVSSTVSYTWTHRVYFGESDLPTLDPNGVKGLRVNQLKNSYLSQYQFLPGGYKNIAIPVDMGIPTRFRDPSTGLNAPMNDPYQVTIVNTYGISIPYNVFRSVYKLGGSVIIEIY